MSSEVRIVTATGGTVSRAKGIINDTHVLFSFVWLGCSIPYQAYSDRQVASVLFIAVHIGPYLYMAIPQFITGLENIALANQFKMQS